MKSLLEGGMSVERILGYGGGVEFYILLAEENGVYSHSFAGRTKSTDGLEILRTGFSSVCRQV